MKKVAQAHEVHKRQSLGKSSHFWWPAESTGRLLFSVICNVDIRFLWRQPGNVSSRPRYIVSLIEFVSGSPPWSFIWIAVHDRSGPQGWPKPNLNAQMEYSHTPLSLVFLTTCKTGWNFKEEFNYLLIAKQNKDKKSPRGNVRRLSQKPYRVTWSFTNSIKAHPVLFSVLSEGLWRKRYI